MKHIGEALMEMFTLPQFKQTSDSYMRVRIEQLEDRAKEMRDELARIKSERDGE